MTIADTIRMDAIDAVAMLHRMGSKVVMLTGDNKRTARAIADQVSVPFCFVWSVRLSVCSFSDLLVSLTAATVCAGWYQ